MVGIGIGVEKLRQRFQVVVFQIGKQRLRPVKRIDVPAWQLTAVIRLAEVVDDGNVVSVHIMADDDAVAQKVAHSAHHVAG